MKVFNPRRHTLALATSLACLSIAGCSGGDGSAGKAADDRPAREWTDAARVEAIAATLQACSYDGNPVNVEASALQGNAPGDCKAMVDKIMGFTGLPANFVVTAGPVPNAAAVILLDQNREPQRVIAFNPEFISATQRATGGSTWSPVSIMAHEIGHHLSGHTITSGGSRPSIELEADKFSGYVLQKMGASLDEATKAMALIASESEGTTHPAKARRLTAISEGWQEACKQAGGNCASDAATTTPPPAPSTGTGTPPPPVLTKVTLPAPSAQTIPFKYGRFVVDETGKFDARALAELDRKLRDLADKQGVEFAFLIVNDLHGMSAEDYAWAMMRQLRIGKLDLGNGGVIVVAPSQGQSGLAFAPGVAKQLEFDQPLRSIDRWLKDDWNRVCTGAKADPEACARSSSLALPSDYMLKRLGEVTWRIRFNSIEESIAFSKARLEERRAGRKWDDKIDQPLGSLVRFTATVTDTAPKPGPEQPQSAEDMRVNPRVVEDGRWQAVLVKTPDGQETTLYMQPQTPSLMPSGKLQVNKQYTFVGELKSTGQFHTDQGVMQINPAVWLFSYEAL